MPTPEYTAEFEQAQARVRVQNRKARILFREVADVLSVPQLLPPDSPPRLVSFPLLRPLRSSPGLFDVGSRPSISKVAKEE